MNERKLYSISEARELMGGICRNSIYALLNRGEIASVVIGCRRFVTKEAISEFIERSTTTATPTAEPARFRKPILPPSISISKPLAGRTQNPANKA